MTMTVAKALVLYPPADLLQDRPGLRQMAARLALRYVHRELVTEELLRAMGEALWRALDADAALARARAAAGLGVLPLVIESSAPAVLQLPWETLHHPELGFLGRDSAGIRFAHAFCDALARRERVDLALQAARGAITRPLEGDGVRAQAAGGTSGQPVPGRRHPAAAFPGSAQGAVGPGRGLEHRQAAPLAHHRLRQSGQDRLGRQAGPGSPGRRLGGSGLVGPVGEPLGKFPLRARVSPLGGQCRALFAHGGSVPGRSCRAKLLLRLLLAQYGERVVLFLDNLESLQRPDTLELDASEAGATLGAWIAAAQELCDQGLVLLVTSRWRLPDWPEADHWQLEHASYGDFLQQARSLRLSSGFYRERERLRRAYRILHGNWRGLEFFAAAVGDLDPAAEKDFLDRLAQAEAETQTDMALETVIAHRTQDERALLARLPAYRTPVPIEGIIKLGLDLPDPERLLKKLLAVSLVEQREAPELLTREYQCSPLVAEWLRKNHVIPSAARDLGAARDLAPVLELQWLQAAADYQRYLYRHERPTLGQAVAVHQALRNAGDRVAADRWALDRIVGPLNRAGLYAGLLSDCLPPIRRSPDPAVCAQALNQTGKQLLHTGDYQTAVGYLQQSLAIQQEIGDAAGLCVTLFNLGHIHLENDEPAEAFGAWVTAYRQARAMGLKEVLDALEKLDGQLGLPGGLDAWEELAQGIEAADADDGPAA